MTHANGAPWSVSVAGRDTIDRLYRLLIESVTDYALFVLDPQGFVRSWNPGAQRFKGYAADEIIGPHFSVFYPQTDIQAGKPAHELEVAARVGRFEDEGWRIRKDGSRFWANVVITALRDSDGILVGFAKITRDLTDRRRAEEQARDLAAHEAARAEAERRSDELADLNEHLQQQATELEAQNEEAQSLTEELEQSTEALQSSLHDAEEAKAAAHRSEQFARAVLASILDALIVIDSDRNVEYHNPAARQLSPIPGNESLAGRPFHEAFPSLQGSGFDACLHEAFERRTPATVETRLAREGRWWSMSCYPLPDGAVLSQWRDVSEGKRAEESRRYLADASAIVGTSLDYQTTLDQLAHKIVPELADWCSIELPDAGGRLQQAVVAHIDPAKERWARTLNQRYPTPPDSPTGTPQVFRTGRPELYPTISDEMLAAGAVDDEHLRIIRELGIVSVMIVPLSAPDRVVGVLTLVSAESKRVYTNDDLELAMELGRRAALAVDHARLHRDTVEARHAAEEANAAKMQFLAVMSHELRTPLNAIAGYSELLQMGLRGPVTPEQLADLERIDRSQRALLSIINDILNFARLEAGRVQFAVESVRIPPLLVDLEALVLPQLREKKLSLVVPRVGESVVARADGEKVRQIPSQPAVQRDQVHRSGGHHRARGVLRCGGCLRCGGRYRPGHRAGTAPIRLRAIRATGTDAHQHQRRVWPWALDQPRSRAGDGWGSGSGQYPWSGLPIYPDPTARRLSGLK